MLYTVPTLSKEQRQAKRQQRIKIQRYDEARKIHEKNIAQHIRDVN